MTGGFLSRAIAGLFGRGEPPDAAPRAPPGAPISAEQRAAIEGNVALVRDDFAKDVGIAFDFSRASLEYLDGFISRQHERGSDHGNLPQIFGSYLGECIRRRDGGQWVVEPEGAVGLEIEPDFTVYPLTKAGKHFANGEDDSILGLYDSIPALLAHHRSRTP